MHLADGLIPFSQAIIYWVIALIFIFLFDYILFKRNKVKEKKIVFIGVLTAVTTVASAVTVPTPFGISIHFFMFPLDSLLLGPVSASIISFIALLFQSFLGIGGFTTLGVNFLIMGLTISFVTYYSYRIFSLLNDKFGIFASTFISIICATILQVFVLIFSGSTNIEMLVSTLVPFYLLVAIIEGILNIFILYLIEKLMPNILGFEKI